MNSKRQNIALNNSQGAQPGESQFDYVKRKISEAQSAVSTLGHSRALSTAITKLDEAAHWVGHEQGLQENASNASGSV